MDWNLIRNLAIHNYDAINWAIVYAIGRYRLTDFEDFAKAIVLASPDEI
ncbi:MAG: hypothetical protein DM484_01775 [Candidatus Methylumidiphilus alinenensis]|uniref:DUF86 domain-containing protein n=1 Tax=Candidatus Methylumidiphilus alinenensis TaxID=2202197 RepID=A0A2W4RS45_9GAMM|nr:MAG: hypothetical protein DM484_01775 [Candidatus Methylumidiphilus alinenensis]